MNWFPNQANAAALMGAVLVACSNGTPVAAPLPPPSVVPPSTAATSSQAILSWVAPKTNTDGSPLVDLVGYNVYRGQSLSGLSRFASAKSPPYVDKNLAPGTYYYAVTAVNAEGVESEMSVAVSKVIP